MFILLESWIFITRSILVTLSLYGKYNPNPGHDSQLFINWYGKPIASLLRSESISVLQNQKFCKSYFYNLRWTWACKNVTFIFFQQGTSGFTVHPFGTIWLSSQDRSPYNWSLFLSTVSYLCVIIESLSSWSFNFLAGVICLIKDKTTNGYKIIKEVRTLS